MRIGKNGWISFRGHVRPTWRELAAKGGIVDTVAFTTCLRDDGVLAEARRDITDGDRRDHRVQQQRAN